MIQKMKNVLVVGPKADYQEIVDVLYQTGALHLEDVTNSYPHLSFTRHQDEAHSDEIATLLLSIGGMLQILPKFSLHPKRTSPLIREVGQKSTDKLLALANTAVCTLDQSTRMLESRRSELDLRIIALSRYEKVFRRIFHLESKFPKLEGFEITVLIIQKEYEEVLDVIKPFFAGITKNQFELISADFDEKNIAVITVFNKKYSERIHDFLYSKNVNEVRIPLEYSNMPLEEALHRLDLDKKAAIVELAEIERTYAALSEQWYEELSVLRIVLQDRYAAISAYEKFGETDYTLVIKGWIPGKYLKRVKKALSDSFGERIVLTILPVTNEMLDQAPVLYNNPFWIKPFEFIMQLVGLPKYREVDPTLIMAISFPLFFGIIVGDIGYGIVILVFATLMKKVFRDLVWLHQIMNILIISAIPTIIFGYLYGEFFGDFAEHMGWLHPVHLFGITWNRVEAIIPMLALAIGLGAVHVFLGLFIGAYNAAVRRNRRHLCEKCGMAGVLIGIFVIGGVFAGVFLPALLNPGALALIISLLVLLYGGGILGIIEIMGTLGNIMSYARLMAIGMASVILAVVANRLGEEIGIIAIGIVITVLLHLLNICLAMFSPSIHSMRLHIVEFFSKFYEGGGEPYRPFGRENHDD